MFDWLRSTLRGRAVHNSPVTWVSAQLLDRTAEVLRQSGDRGQPHEGIVYWAGHRVGHESFVTTCIIPAARTTYGSFATTSSTNARVVMYLAERSLELLGQVHSHPGALVDHSDGDDKRALMPYDGFLSLVVPHYARDGLRPLTSCGVHVFERVGFQRLPDAEVATRFRVVDDFADLRPMSIFPTSPGEFYALRDDRTTRCCTELTYQTASCLVVVSRAAAVTATGQMMLATTANLLSRWCRSVTIAMPRVEALPSLRMGKGDLGGLVLVQMRDADPFGNFRIREAGPSPADVTLVIGADACAEPSPTTIFINASGWLAGISRQGPVNLATISDSNLLGAIAAASLGVAQVFKLALKMPAEQLVNDGIFDLFHLRWSSDGKQAPWPDGLTFGNLLMVGAGSVGSAAVYCLRATGLSGAISVVDGDVVKIENFNRSPLFGRDVFGLGKAKTVERFLSGSNLIATAVSGWWKEYLGQRPRSSFDFDVWLPLANEFDVRRAMQHNLPPLMIHASTTQNWGVNHGRHIPGRDDCLVERFQTKAVTAEDLKCSTAQIQVADETVDAALPFASMFAGLLVAADLVRAQLPGYPQIPNFAHLDWYGPLNLIQVADRVRQPGCPTCSAQGRSFHEKFNGRTRYWHLFQV